MSSNGISPLALAVSMKRYKYGASVGPTCGIGKHPVFPADSKRFDGPLGTVVTDV